MSKQELLQRIRELSSPVEPKSFQHPVRLQKLPDIKAVAFDFYGTMFLSGVGDIGVDQNQKEIHKNVFRNALKNSGFSIQDSSAGQKGIKTFQNALDGYVRRRKKQGIAYPEPNIIAIWQQVISQLLRKQVIGGPLSDEKITRFAIEYEFGVNNIWPVPDLKELLTALLNKGLKLGIISNSQFYTPLAFEALMDISTEAFGFDPDLQVWSYVQGEKKPSLSFYRVFVKQLQSKDIAPGQLLYAGNDLFKDVIPAKKLNMQTALYVGDERSIRHQKADLTAGDHQPDLIIDDLHQILDCID